jgi:hypothetical protein
MVSIPLAEELVELRRPEGRSDAGCMEPEKVEEVSTASCIADVQ